MVPREQHLHGKPIAGCNASDQDFVRSGLHCLTAELVRLVAGGSDKVQKYWRETVYVETPTPRPPPMEPGPIHPGRTA